MGKETRILITGGCGYVGSNLAKELTKRDYKVVLYDQLEPQEDLARSTGIIYTRGDILNTNQLSQAFSSGVDSVIHVAGYGLAGTTNLPAYDEITKQVNLTGTRNVIAACLQHNVKALVFTSTVNVGFNGTEIINGNEESNKWLANDDSHIDYYSWTKQMAEQYVIQANNQLCDDQVTTLKTCVLRLGGVYGPDEKVILQRSLNLMMSKVGFLAYSHHENLKIDFAHIDNVVQGHIKANEALLKESNSLANGQIFYITDDNPTNIYSFLDPLYTLISKETKCPRLFEMNPFLSYMISYIFIILSNLFGKCFSLPFWGFTLMEAYKVTVTHYFSIEKARRILHYKPRPITREDWSNITKTYVGFAKARQKRPKWKGHYFYVHGKGLRQFDMFVASCFFTVFTLCIAGMVLDQ